MSKRLLVFILLLSSFLLAACGNLPTPAPTQPSSVTVTILADGLTQTKALTSTLTVREALAQAGIVLGDLDRLSPAPYTIITDKLQITIVRVTESFETETAVVPFESQVIRNEGLPAGERRLLQAGVNGSEEITYRTTFEDGKQLTRNIVKRAFIQPPTPEIIMVGAQASFTIVPVTGTLAYISGNNAWVMRGNSGNRIPLTTLGDLDGRIFELSADGAWLLFSRAPTVTNDSTFNSLWAVTTTVGAQPLFLSVTNTLYAEWSPTVPRVVAYSTADKIARAPGWQATNDLWWLTWETYTTTNRLRPTQTIFTKTQVVDVNAGGLYGWWGTGYAFAPDGNRMAYARTDSIGWLDIGLPQRNPLSDFAAYNTRSDWAWHPFPHWTSDGNFLYTVVHGAPRGLELPEDSPVFDLVAVSLASGGQYNLVPGAGMFANPVPAPAIEGASFTNPPLVAYLQALEPDNSPFSKYRLGVMDRDGSNQRLLFPAEGQPGIEAGETPTWSSDGRILAIVYDGNLWLIDATTGASQQLTGDGLSQRPVWGK